MTIPFRRGRFFVVYFIHMVAKFFSRTTRKNIVATSFVFLFAFPASTNYQLKSYGFGSGGEENMSSTNYSMDAITGETNDEQLSGTNYDMGSGLIFTQQANVPPAPTFTNPSSYYNKLLLVLDAGNNPTDAKFAIAITPDNWTTTLYVQSDGTAGVALGSEDYQTYANWGGASGEFVIGLLADTTYAVKVKATQGKFTETGYGPEASVATVAPTLSFDIDVAGTDTETNPPFAVAFGSLIANAVTDGPEKIWVDFATNGASGGKVYVSSGNGGLSSVSAGATIASATADLAVATSGYGAQGSSVTQASGGPLAFVSPYNGAAGNVGIVDTSLREIFASSLPIVGGRGSFLLKAKSSPITPAASDYTDTLTVVVSASF